MITSTKLVRDIYEVEHFWIVMPDSIKLAARMWAPQLGSEEKIPCIFEFIPYRKRDMVRARDERNHPYFARHGFACLRVDMRGSGDSEGSMLDMYSNNELADARHIINWIAQQSWCNGSVGMFGTSWGGTASLQAAVEAHPALRAVIAVCATHDRYDDDIHHMGGCLLTESIEWGATLPAILASPPDAATFGEEWMEAWRSRLEKLAFPLETWLSEESRGSYWRRGSVIHQAEKLSCPILAVGGWSDRYSNSVMSLVDARPDICWGVIGPWGHHYPDVGHPGPTVGFQELALEWWNHWLQPDWPAQLDWPKLRAWLREFDPPADVIDERNGYWIESGILSQTTVPQTLHLSTGGLSTEVAISSPWHVPYDLSVGSAGGDTGYFGRFGGQPLEQSGDDSRSLAFDTGPLPEDFDLFGAAESLLTLSYRQRVAQLVLRINDIAPDERVTRVTFIPLNLTLDDKLDEPNNPIKGESRQVNVRFPTAAYKFRKGHRIRLSISSSYWPMIWPAPEETSCMIEAGTLTLPTPINPLQELTSAFTPSDHKSIIKNYDIVSAPKICRRSFTMEDGTGVVEWRQPESAVRFHASRTTFSYQAAASHRIRVGDPLSATSSFNYQLGYDRPDGKATVSSRVEVRCNLVYFVVSGELLARWNDREVARRDWAIQIPRRFS